MKRILTLFLLALPLGGCGGSDGFTPSPELLAAAECVGLSLEDLNEIFGEVTDLLNSIGGVIPPNMTYDIATGDYTITLSFGTLAGTVVSPDDLDDGLGDGESATAPWALNGGLAGVATVTGEGSITMARSTATNFTVSGNGAVTDGTCVLDSPAFNLAVNTASTLGPVGTLNFTGTTPGGVITGLMTFDGSDLARITSQFAGEAVTFYLDLDTFIPEF
jgi:hypothetical protein